MTGAAEGLSTTALAFENLRNPASVQEWRRVVAVTAGHIVVIAAFAAFVRLNGGVVVGDKAAHPGVLHVMQLWYFALFTGGALLLLSDALAR